MTGDELRSINLSREELIFHADNGAIAEQH